jgi:hypothetical protein
MADSISISPTTATRLRSAAGPLATGLGWFSLALGTTQLLAGRNIAAWLGASSSISVRLFYGARELGAGAGLLRSTKPAPWLWARVCGDALDLGTLLVLARSSRRTGNVAIMLAAVAGVTALDVVCALADPRRQPG